MRVAVDKGIPFLDGVLDSVAEVLWLAPEEFTADAVKDVDALFIRTRTQIGEELLEGSKVRFVATATIGYDHIDQAYCAAKGISWVSCPGCNAQAVCDYVEEAISALKPEKSDLVVGVVGYGNVGKLVAEMAANKGYKVLVSDPPLEMGMSLLEIAPQCDVLTFHTPLTPTGEFSTYHLCNEEVMRACKKDVLLINAARGGVVDEAALLSHLCCDDGSEVLTVIDCWEGEPLLNKKLLQRVDLASFHIAGYSIQGKMNASEMCLRAFCAFFSLPILSINKKAVSLQGDSKKGWLVRVTQMLKAYPDTFEELRKAYRLR